MGETAKSRIPCRKDTIVPPPDTVFHHLVNVWGKQDFAKVRNVFTCVVQVDDLDCLWEMQFGQILDPFGAIA